MKFTKTTIAILSLIFSLPVCSIASSQSTQVEVQALMPGMVVLLVDGQRVTLKTGSEKQGVKLINATSKTAVLEVNGQQKNYQMGTSVSTSFRERTIITERVIFDRNGMFNGYGSINGQSVRFLIDTGATTVAMSAKDARKLGIQYQLEGTPATASTASGVAKAWSITLKSVRLGKLLEHNVRSMVVDGNYPRQVLLGMSFLNRMRVEKEGNTMTISRKK